MKSNRNILKKSFLMIMAIVMVFSLFACGSKHNANETADTSEINETEETEIVAEKEQGEETAPTDVDTDDYDVDPNLMDEDGEAPHGDEATVPGSDEWYFIEDTNKTPTSSYASSTHSYVGRFKINSVGVDVACYSTNAQSIVDAWDSAACYSGYGHTVIADHVNQGFSAIKSCQEGTEATLVTVNGTKTYKCVGKINGRNTGTTLTDANGNSIRDMYPGALIAYTCNGNWQDIAIVFFEIEEDDYSNTPVEDEYNEAYYPSQDSANDYITCAHNWEMVNSFTYVDPARNSQRFLHEVFVCSKCNADWLKDTPIGDSSAQEEKSAEPAGETEPPVIESEEIWNDQNEIETDNNGQDIDISYPGVDGGEIDMSDFGADGGEIDISDLGCSTDEVGEENG